MLSVVVPIFNEEESVEAFYAELIKHLHELKKPYEIIFIDDGSTDETLPKLKQLHRDDKSIRIFSFRKNQGKAEALTLGFYNAKGDVVVTLDADLQDQPSEIKKLLARHEEGIDVVCGWRKDRKDASRMVAISKMFNAVVGWLFDVHLHDYNCGLKLYAKEAAKSLKIYGGQHRFIPLLVAEQGFSVDEVPIVHQPRKYGKSKYSFAKIKDLPDIFTMLFLSNYSKMPLHFFGPIGGGLALSGCLIFLYLCFIWFMGESIGRRPLLMFSILLMLGGLQIFFTGFLAELFINLTSKNQIDFPIKYSTDRT